MLFKLERSCLKFPKIEKAVWSYPKLNKDVPLDPNLNGAVVVSSWFSLLEFAQNFQIYGNIFNLTQIWMK